VDDAVLTVGSSSAIFAHQAARLGLRVAFAGKVEPDVFGEFMVDRLRKVGVETSTIVMDPGVKTGVTVHLVRRTDWAMLTHPGSIAALRPDDVAEALLANTRHVHLGSYFLR
jgi:sugar/nucleoside kinase (ribokinase family)